MVNLKLADPRALLGIASVYSAFRGSVARNASQVLVEDFICPKPGIRILDIGCGPADILEYLPEVEYHGFDLSSKYIRSAQKRFGSRGNFWCKKVNDAAFDELGEFDVVIATGVVHHLDDAEARSLFELARRGLKPAGRLITFDGCFITGQGFLARTFLKMDRGQFVRNKVQYESLAQSVFPYVATDIRTDLLRIPYTHIIMQCAQTQIGSCSTRPQQSAA